jgi:hypothetical protein
MTRAIFFCAIVLLIAFGAYAQEINPEEPPDPLNKVFFGARIYPEKNGPVRSMQTEVDTVKECIEHATKALAESVDGAKAIEVRCIKEKNAEKPL